MRCPIAGCGYDASERQVQRHLRDHHHHHSLRGNGRRNVLNIFPFTEMSAFRGFLQSYRHRIVNSKITSIYTYFKKYYKQIHKIYKLVKRRSRRSIKTQITLAVTFFRGDDGDYEEISRYENSKLKMLHSMHEFDEMLSYAIAEIVNYIELFESYGSGWQLKCINGCDLRIGLLPFIGGGCFVELSPFLKNKRCSVNVRNTDNECFKYAFLSVAHYDDVQSHRYRVTKYTKYMDRYDFSGMQFPAKIRDVDIFNKNNRPLKICVNIFGTDDEIDGNVVPIKISKDALDPSFKKYNLLLFQDASSCNEHYIGISDIGRLFGKSSRKRHEFCYSCVNMITKKSWEKHSQLCSKSDMQKVSVPYNELKDNPGYETEMYTEFDSIRKLCAHEYAIFADFESILESVPDPECDANLKKISLHKPCGYAYVVIQGNKLIKKKVYRGEDTIKNFFKQIIKEVKKIKQMYEYGLLMTKLSEEENEIYEQSRECHICRKEILETEEKVRDHNPFNGDFRGSAHRECNAEYTLKKARIPIVFHGFRNYDSHLLIEGFQFFGKKISVLPSNSEKYMSILCDDFVFLDSTLFLNASLATLVDNLKSTSTEIDVVQDFEDKFGPLIDAFGFEKAADLSRKGVYPYTFLKSFALFDNTHLPEKSAFYNDLTDEHITDEEYAYAQSVFTSYCKTLGDYHDLYLLTDALLLGTVFQYFRKVTISHYRLDPLHYYSLSQYSLDAALLMSDARLEMLTDLDMYTFFEASLRGGISSIVTREAFAKNKHLNNCKNPDDSTYLCYLDKVNLYGEAFLHKLPIRDFKWMDDEDVNKLNQETILNWDAEGDTGYTLMVDLNYPPHLHFRDNDLPLCPEKIQVPKRNLSSYQRKLLRKQKIKYSEKIKKLIPHLGERKEYVLHFRNLQFYLRMGMELVKVHRCVQYTQVDWMRNYVLFNANMRKQAKNTFEKNLFKFFVNAVFGKSIEQVRSRRRIKIVNRKEDVLKYLKSPFLKTWDILSENLAIFELHNCHVMLDKPVYVGVTILDLSKLFLYEFHYKFKEFYNDNVKLLFSDTDSLAYSVKTKNIFSDFWHFRDQMDFSDYPRDHFLFSEKNKKRIGCMKDEGNSKIFTHFIGLAPKLYSFAGVNIYKNAAKGIKKSVVKKSLRHKMFKKSLRLQKTYCASVTSIRSFKHKIYTVRQKKVGLRCFDSKRYILPSGVNTLSHNHFLLKPLKRCM